MIKQKLQNDQLQALKSGQTDRLSTIRYILAQIKNKEIEKNIPDKELSEDEIINILKKIVKELKESIEAFEKGKRQELVDQYKKQLEVVSSYLPEEISDEQLQKAINEILEKNKELYNKNPKAIIGICMKELRLKADSSRIIKMLNQLTHN